MNKKDILKKVSSLEEEIKDLKTSNQECCDEPKCIMERVKTFEDACKITGIIPAIYENSPKDTIAYEKLKVIVRALNEGWIPNWEDSNEKKYYPYFRMSPFGFDDTLCGYWSANSATGSRLRFKSAELAKYAGKQFVDLYRDLME